MPLDEVGALVTHRLMPRGKFKSVVREGGCEEQLVDKAVEIGKNAAPKSITSVLTLKDKNLF